MLNEQLFKLLQSAFGPNVKIAKQGQQAVWRIEKGISGETIVFLDYGETYRVCCPFCAHRGDPDSRHRLWISHVYGTRVGKYPCWYAATCFHNACLENESARRELRNWIFGLASHRRVRMPTFSSGSPKEVEVPELPGVCLKLSELPKKHKALRFLIGKGLDPAKLQELYSVCYCIESEYNPLAIDRLVFPIDNHGKRVGWQCRYIGTPLSKHIPKYVSCKNIKETLYNYDRAIQQPFIVVTEGVFDALKVGFSGVCLFGKTISIRQMDLLSRFSGPIVVFLDPDADKEADELVRLFSKSHVVHVIKGARNDPGKLTQDEINEHLKPFGLSVKDE